MYEALTYQIMLEDISDNIRKHGILNDKIGILMTRPDLPTGKSILDSLEYFHFRTGNSLNFYLAGYGAYWPNLEYPDGKVVTVIDGVKWLFSNQKFVQFVSDLETYSKWSYSGESELLLVELKNGILFSRIHPKNNALPILAEHFTNRFPQENFLIYDENHDLAALHRAGSNYILADASGINKELLLELSEREEEFQDLWLTFFESIAIKERTNLPLQAQNIPKRFWNDTVEFKPKQ